MENVVKRGYLECYVRGVAPTTFQWQKRYYVLYGASATNQGRLDYYDDEEAYRTEPKVRKTIYLEEVRQAMSEVDAEKLYTFQLIMCRSEKRTYRFAASSEQGMLDWLKAIELAQREDLSLQPGPLEDRILVDKNAIYESAEDLQQYTVEVQETEAAKRCHLKIGTPYELYVLSEYLCLAEKNKRILSWSYKHIRRYGCGENNFTFEAGRKSLSGEGLFSFLVSRGEQLFRNVQERMKHMQKRQNPEKDEFNKLLRGENAPNLPSRNYLAEGEPTHGTLPFQRNEASEGAAHAGIANKPKVPPKLPALIKNKNQEKKAATDGMAAEKPVAAGKMDTNFQSELNSKLAKKPPMLRPRGQPTSPPVSERLASLGPTPRSPLPPSSSPRISTGENYELAKSNLPGSALRKPLAEYEDTTEERELDVNYSETKKAREGNAVVAYCEPEYAEYDIARSSRFMASNRSANSNFGEYSEATLPKMVDAWKQQGINEDDHQSDEEAAAGPIYDTPAEAEVETPKMSAIIAKLNKMKTPAPEAEYDHLGQHLTDVPSPPQGLYDHVGTRP